MIRKPLSEHLLSKITGFLSRHSEKQKPDPALEPENPTGQDYVRFLEEQHEKSTVVFLDLFTSMIIILGFILAAFTLISLENLQQFAGIPLCIAGIYIIGVAAALRRQLNRQQALNLSKIHNRTAHLINQSNQLKVILRNVNKFLMGRDANGETDVFGEDRWDVKTCPSCEATLDFTATNCKKCRAKQKEVQLH